MWRPHKLENIKGVINMSKNVNKTSLSLAICHQPPADYSVGLSRVTEGVSKQTDKRKEQALGLLSRLLNHNLVLSVKINHVVFRDMKHTCFCVFGF